MEVDVLPPVVAVVEDGGIADAQAVGEVVQQREPAVVAPLFGGELDLVLRALLVPVHRPGRLVAAQGEDVGAVVAQDAPSQRVTYGAQLADDPLVHVQLQLPGVTVVRGARR